MDTGWLLSRNLRGEIELQLLARHCLPSMVSTRPGADDSLRVERSFNGLEFGKKLGSRCFLVRGGLVSLPRALVGSIERFQVERVCSRRKTAHHHQHRAKHQ